MYRITKLFTLPLLLTLLLLLANTARADYSYGFYDTTGTGDHKPTMTPNGTYTKPTHSPTRTGTNTGTEAGTSTGSSTGGQSSTTSISSAAERVLVQAGSRDVLVLIGMVLGSGLFFVGL
ncbi:hypothetical protein B0J14DRAFT_701125 [Halenospora varia]|nr:hypothetical protein B0J14DRAFT_701125 [Halenospora varia]